MKPAALVPLAAFLVLGACSMSSEWWVDRGYRIAGFDRAEAKCATNGVVSQLSEDELTEVRIAVSDPGRPKAFAGAESLLQWLQPRIAERSYQILAHYARHCRKADSAPA